MSGIEPGSVLILRLQAEADDGGVVLSDEGAQLITFGEAVERMWRRRVDGREGMPQSWLDAVRVDCEADLRAALGEGL